MPSIPRFRIYYADGSTYRGDPFRAPPTGVQVIAQEEVGAKQPLRLLYGRDYYVWDERLGPAWNNCDDGGLWDYLMLHIGPKVVLFGRTVRDADYYAFLERARREGFGS